MINIINDRDSKDNSNNNVDNIDHGTSISNLRRDSITLAIPEIVLHNTVSLRIFS